MQYFTLAQNLDFLLRLLVACACGAAIECLNLVLGCGLTEGLVL